MLTRPTAGPPFSNFKPVTPSDFPDRLRGHGGAALLAPSSGADMAATHTASGLFNGVVSERILRSELGTKTQEV